MEPAAPSSFFIPKIYVEDMSLKVCLFGITRDIVGTSVIELPAPAPATVGELLAAAGYQVTRIVPTQSFVSVIEAEAR